MFDLPRYSCQVVTANAYTKLDSIFDMHDITPISASSILSKWEKTPTENNVPISPVSMPYVEKKLNSTSLQLNR